MDEQFYDPLEEESFCECCSHLDDELSSVNDVSKNLDNSQKQKSKIPTIIRLFQNERLKKAPEYFKKKSQDLAEVKKTNRHPPPVREKKKNRTYLNLFYTKIKYPAIGGGDVLKSQSGSDTISFPHNIHYLSQG
ncbi:hypothetical protein HHI36_018050 [Cryptolaemus montrouzieri]|uniref:Uncharacterized protein n=1 Tax=Cryptolaemus montrouzieri TaxID=559131 RepID=A0ABD2NYU6_9CUCU